MATASPTPPIVLARMPSCWRMLLWGIARSYDTTVNRLLEQNRSIKNPNLIYVGQKVRVA